MGHLEQLISENLTLFLALFLFSEFSIFLVILLISIFLIFKKDKVDLKTFLLRLVFCSLVLFILKISLDNLWGRERPYLIFSSEIFKSLFPQDKNFISGHSSFGLMLSLLSFYLSPALGYVNIFISILGSISRVILLIHWPQDIILGWWLSFFIFIISVYLFKKKR